MAVIRRNVPATTQDIHATQWLFNVVEGMAQEKDGDRLVYVATTTGKRMTRTPEGQFVGLDGSAVTEDDMATGFSTPTVMARRLEMTIAFKGDDEQATVGDLKATLTGPQFTKVRNALKLLAGMAMAEKVSSIEGAEIVEGEDSPLDKM